MSLLMKMNEIPPYIVPLHPASVAWTSRWKWHAALRGRLHVRRAALRDFEERIVHAVILLRDKEDNRKIVIACSCCAVFWFDADRVHVEQLNGDWARPFRNELQIPARVVRR